MRPLYDYYHYFNRLLYIQLLGILFFLVLRTMMIDSISFLFRTRTKYFLSPDFNSVSYVPHWKSRKYINCNYLRLEILKTLCSSAWLIAFPYFQPRAIGTGGCQRCTCTPYFLGQRNKIYPEFLSLCMALKHSAPPNFSSLLRPCNLRNLCVLANNLIFILESEQQGNTYFLNKYELLQYTLHGTGKFVFT